MARLKSLVTAAVALVLAGALTMSLTAQAGPTNGHAVLSGYEENPTLSSSARGTSDIQIGRDGQSVAYTLTYSGFTANILFAHIHLGRPAINGSVMVFLCTNGAPPANAPAPPACPQNAGTVKGTLTAAHVLASTNPPQGIAAGEFAEFVQALRAEAAYVNVHTETFPGGEIRGQVTFGDSNSQGDRSDSQGNQN
jgi:hypothetical protein